MATDMFVGAYWSQRRESRENAANRISRFLQRVSCSEPEMARWFLKGRTRAAAVVPLGLSPAEIAPKLRVNRRDVGGSVINELGFGCRIWNGIDTSFAATIGAFSAAVSNSAVLSLSKPLQARKREYWRDLLDAFIEEFDPDHAVVTDFDVLRSANAQEPWQAGLFTFERGGAPMVHQIL